MQGNQKELSLAGRALGPQGICTSLKRCWLSARADLLGRLGKSIIFSLLAPLHLSHMQCYKLWSRAAALLYITAPHSPGALEPKFRGLSDRSLAMERNTQRVVCSAFPLQTSFKLCVTLPFSLTFPMPQAGFLV